MSDNKETILRRLLLRIPDEYDKTVGSFFYDTQVPLAIEHEELYKKLDGILDKGFAATATGVYLERKAAEQGITRKAATYAEGTVRISGSVNAVVSAGQKVSSDLATYTILETETIAADGSVTVAVRCDAEGFIGNVPVGAVKDFPVSITGVTTVTNTEVISGGYDAETDEELRKRYFEKVFTPATSGNKHHYVLWAKEIPGVGDARVLPLWNGNGTVKVIILGSDKKPAETALIEKVMVHIEENKPIGAAVTVVTASAVTITVSATLTLEPGYTAALVKPVIEEAINSYIKKIAFLLNYVSVAHIGSAILTVDGVLDFTNLKVNNGTANIGVSDSQVAVLGTVTLNA